MVKHGINSFLANSIVFANHLADICELKGARIDDVVKGMKSDPRIGLKAYLSPGIGFSGGTLGRDLKVMESENLNGTGYAKLFGAIHQMNSERKYSIVDRCAKILGELKGKTISVLGVTYKPGTSTLRRSLPLEIVDLLVEKGATVKVFDPKADYSELNKKPAFSICKSIEEATENSDLVLLLTEWPEFKKFDWDAVMGKMRSAVVFDTKNHLDEKIMTSADFKYYSVGR
jgi:UDPglucose 6-dehydrogenase